MYKPEDQPGLAHELVKLRLRSPDGTVETPWAIALGNGRFKVDNIPFFAYGVSSDDVVLAVPEEDGVLALVRVDVPSGNRTLRVIFREKVTKEEPLLLRLSEMGVGWEGAFAKLVALSVPHSVDLDAVVRLLVESGLECEYANPTWAELHRNQ